MIVFVCLSGCVRLSADRCVSPHHSSCQRHRRGRRRWRIPVGCRSASAVEHSLKGVLAKSYVGQRQPAANSPPITTVCNAANAKKKSSIWLDSSLITSPGSVIEGSMDQRLDVNPSHSLKSSKSKGEACMLAFTAYIYSIYVCVYIYIKSMCVCWTWAACQAFQLEMFIYFVTQENEMCKSKCQRRRGEYLTALSIMLRFFFLVLLFTFGLLDTLLTGSWLTWGEEEKIWRTLVKGKKTREGRMIVECTYNN